MSSTTDRESFESRTTDFDARTLTASGTPTQIQRLAPVSLRVEQPPLVVRAR